MVCRSPIAWIAFSSTGSPVDRPLCDFVPHWQANNKQSRLVTLPRDGSFVTEPCTRSQSGPLRDCGFTKQPTALACSPGREATLRCATDNGKPMQVKEDDRIELFQGTIPPRTRVIRSSTFARNLEALAAYVRE